MHRIIAGRRRKRAYFLTAIGRKAARQVEGTLDEPFGDDGKTLSELWNETRGRLTIAELLQRAEDDVRNLKQLHQVPDSPELFVGRQKEWKQVRSALKGSGNLALYGLAGVGKTTLALRVMDLLGKDRDVLWWTSSRWDSFDSLLAFLTDYGKVRGREGAALRLRDGQDTLQVLAELRSIFKECKPLIILDSFDELSDPRALDLVRELLGMDAAVLLTSREPVFSPHEVTEFQVGGLSPTDSIEFLEQIAPGASAERREDIAKHCGGHPLAMQLSQPRQSWDLTAQEELFRFIRKEVVQLRSQDEQELARLASVYTQPVDPTAALTGPLQLPGESLGRLLECSVFSRFGADVALSPLLRSYYQAVTPDQIKANHAANASVYYEGRRDLESMAVMLQMHHLQEAGQDDQARSLYTEHRDEFGQFGYPAVAVLQQLDRELLQPDDRIDLLLTMAGLDPDQRASLVQEAEDEIALLDPGAQKPLWATRIRELKGEQWATVEALQEALEGEDLPDFERGRLHKNLGYRLKEQKDLEGAQSNYMAARELFRSCRLDRGGRPRSARLQRSSTQPE